MKVGLELAAQVALVTAQKVFALMGENPDGLFIEGPDERGGYTVTHNNQIALWVQIGFSDYVPVRISRLPHRGETYIALPNGNNPFDLVVRERTHE